MLLGKGEPVLAVGQPVANRRLAGAKQFGEPFLGDSLCARRSLAAALTAAS